MLRQEKQRGFGKLPLFLRSYRLYRGWKLRRKPSSITATANFYENEYVTVEHHEVNFADAAAKISHYQVQPGLKEMLKRKLLSNLA